MPKLKIGFTERGDGGLDLSWAQKCKDRKVDGAVIITKSLTDKCIEAILELTQNDFPVILHATCTGWGGTEIEPGAYPYTAQMDQMLKLKEKRFPLSHMVLRIDPIWPTKNGIKRACEVIDAALERNILPAARCRISVLDEYRHVKQRIIKVGYMPAYGPDRFYPNIQELEIVQQALSKYPMVFETCAEPFLSDKNHFRQAGCLSETDYRLMGFSVDTELENMQHRNGCHCLSGKTELLTERHPCPNKCIYCYWKD